MGRKQKSLRILCHRAVMINRIRPTATTKILFSILSLPPEQHSRAVTHATNSIPDSSSNGTSQHTQSTTITAATPPPAATTATTPTTRKMTKTKHPHIITTTELCTACGQQHTHLTHQQHRRPSEQRQERKTRGRHGHTQDHPSPHRSPVLPTSTPACRSKTSSCEGRCTYDEARQKMRRNYK